MAQQGPAKITLAETIVACFVIYALGWCVITGAVSLFVPIGGNGEGTPRWLAAVFAGAVILFPLAVFLLWRHNVIVNERNSRQQSPSDSSRPQEAEYAANTNGHLCAENASDELTWATKILNVKLPITRDELKRSYRAAAKATHPDLAGTTLRAVESGAEFSAVRRAYGILCEYMASTE